MRTLIKETFALAIRLSALPVLIREVLCRKKVTIVMYHDPEPDVFAKHLEYFSKHYHLIPLDHFVDAIQAKDGSKLPPKSLVITIDDGHAGNYQLLPLIKAYKIRPTIYLCTQIINTNRHFWFKATGIPERQHGKYRDTIKELNTSERLVRLKSDFDYEPEKEFRNRQTLNLQELVEMAPHVDFQAHTRFHPILTACTEDVCRQEIEGSKSDLKTLLNVECEHFSYPNGGYTEREITIVKKSGYKSARTSDRGWNDINADPHRLKVLGLTDDASVNQLITQLSGIVQIFKYRFNLPPFNRKYKRKMWQEED